MDKIKAHVLKSKSSNATISKDQRPSKSLSRAEIAPLKKRGVYDEKKSNISSVTDASAKIPKKPKVVPRPGRKRFLSSILTILSKSSTATQFPELPNKMKGRKRRGFEDGTMGDLKKKTPKYRSKILNDHTNLQQDNIVVVQYKRDVTQTSSNFSQNKSKDKVSIKWSDMVSKNDSNVTVVNGNDDKLFAITNGVEDKQLALFNHIEAGKAQWNEKLEIPEKREEPVTLIANEQQTDKKMYDFFVDLLESTLNVYNVNCEADGKHSNLALELTETASKRYNDEKQPIVFNPQRVVCMNDDGNDNYLDNNGPVSFRSLNDRLLDEVRSPQKSIYNIFLENELPLYLRPDINHRKTRGKRNLKSQSFTHKKKTIDPSRSFEQNNAPSTKRAPRRDRKKTILNLLKEQLSMEPQYEEPENFFESLQRMAKYKSRCQKSIKFDESAKKNVQECTFKSHRVLSTFSSKKSTIKAQRSDRTISRKPIPYVSNRADYFSDKDMDSQLSLQVYNENHRQFEEDVSEPSECTFSSHREYDDEDEMNEFCS